MISLALSVRAVPVVLALLAPPQPLTNPDAKAKLQAAQAAFKANDFDAAAAAVEAAYIIEPNPILLYPWAQAERSRGNCAAAVELYRRFLDSDPPEAAATPARENMQRCQEQLEAEAAAQPEETDVVEEVIEEDPEPEPEPEPVTPKDDAPKAKAWYADPVGGVLVGVGVVGVGVGAGLMGAGASRAGKAADVETHSEYLDARDKATGLRNGGAIALSIGGALIVGGVVRYVLVAKKSGQSKQGKQGKAAAWRMTPALGRQWTGVTVGRRF
jgi:tetratricopeptide (TPR) repeat protein